MTPSTGAVCFVAETGKQVLTEPASWSGQCLLETKNGYLLPGFHDSSASLDLTITVCSSSKDNKIQCPLEKYSL